MALQFLQSLLGESHLPKVLVDLPQPPQAKAQLPGNPSRGSLPFGEEKKKKSRLEWGCGRDGQKKKGGKSCETCFGRPGLPSPSICVPYCADPVFDVFPESRDIILSPTAPEPTNRETARPGHRPPAGWPRKWSRCPDALGPGALPLWTPARLDPRCPTDGS